MAQTFISALGYHHPPQRLTNDDLVATVETSAEWILDHTGIEERRVAAVDADTSDLAVLATRAALERSDWKAEDVELLICATSTPDTLAPATASHVAGKLGLRAVPFDLNASCSGFVYGLAVAEALMGAGRHERVALCAAEKYTRVVDRGDRRFAIFFGDSAGAVLLEPTRPARGLEVVDIALSARNEGAELATTPVEGWFSMDGAAIKPIATDLLVASSTTMLRRHGLEVSDLRAFMGHQMNLRLLEELVEQLGVSEAQHWHNVETRGNQGGAGIVTTLCAGVEARQDELRDGDLLLLSVVGSGFTAGSALLRWVA